jgi:hypothetical protein
LEFDSLLKVLIKKYKEKRGVSPGKTKLIKLAYLAELYYKRLTGERLTRAEWVFWHFGPYVMTFEDILYSGPFEVEELEDIDFRPVNISQEAEAEVLEIEQSLSPIEETALFRALEFADKDLDEILDFVYFDTEPMLEAKKRGEVLSFGAVLPEDAYRVKKLKLSSKAKDIIKAKRQQWLERSVEWK